MLLKHPDHIRMTRSFGGEDSRHRIRLSFESDQREERRLLLQSERHLGQLCNKLAPRTVGRGVEPESRMLDRVARGHDIPHLHVAR